MDLTLLVQSRSFQSTLPRGSDHGYTYQCETYQYFNPRSLAGATIKFVMDLVNRIFQSTLPRGSDCRR